MIRLGAGTMKVEARERSVWIMLRGEFDLMNVPDLGDALETAVGGRPCQVVIDLGQTSFVDARMLRLLVDLQQYVTSRGGTLALRTNRNVCRLLAVAGLDELSTCATCDQLLTSGKKRAVADADRT